MADKKYSQLSAAGTLTGAEILAVDQSSTSVRTTTQAIANLASGGTPGGSDTQIQFNDSSAFGGNAAFTFNKTTGLVTFKHAEGNFLQLQKADGTAIAELRILASTDSFGGSVGLGLNALANASGDTYNVAIGPNALAANTTGAENVAVGEGALHANTTGNLNTAVGEEALYAATTAIKNTAVGAQSLIANTTGSQGVAVGALALSSNTTGSNNTGVGFQALTANTTGADNTGCGYGTLAVLTTGTKNVAVGRDALNHCVTGSQNIAIGRSAGSLATGSTNICIGDTSDVQVAGNSNQLNIGNAIYGLNLYASNFNMGIATTTPTARLHLPAGTATASSAPLKLTAGTNLSTPENGAFEWDGSTLTFTQGGTRSTILPAAGGGNVTHTGTLTANAIMLGNGGADITALGSLGTTTTVLHGNASGAPTFGAVNLATDVTGALGTTINAQTGASYTIVAGDAGKLVTLSNSGAVAVTVPQAGTTGFGATVTFTLLNLGAGLVTATPTTSTVNGAASVKLATGQSATFVSDGTNYDATFGGQTANALRSATTIVDTSAATAPSNTQVLKASSSTAAAWAQVAESELTFTDITTNNVSTSKHGFAPKLPNDATKYLDGTGAYTVPSGGGGGGLVGFVPPTGRLTLTTGVPVTISDVTGATTIYYTPYIGNTICLWNGSAWTQVAFTQVSLALGTLSNAKPYDVFGFLSSGNLATELLAWTNDTTRATAITLQDGAYCKSGDHTRLYLGTFYTTATTTTEDSALNRLVFNMYNRKLRQANATDGTSHTYGTAAWRYWNNSSANRVNVIVGVQEDTTLCTLYSYNNPASNGTSTAIGVDVNTSATSQPFYTLGNGTLITCGSINLTQVLSAGFHYIASLENGSTGTGTYNISILDVLFNA